MGSPTFCVTFLLVLTVVNFVCISTEPTKLVGTFKNAQNTSEPCRNGDAIKSVQLVDSKFSNDQQLSGACEQFDSCTRYCYDAEDCLEHPKHPANNYTYIKTINFTVNEDGSNRYEFHCCASSLKFLDCNWISATGKYKVTSQNQTISGFKVTDMSKQQMELQICTVDRSAGQKPTPLCYVDSCNRYGSCNGKFDGQIPTSNNFIMEFNDASPYGLLLLFGLEGLQAIPTASGSSVTSATSGPSATLAPTTTTTTAAPIYCADFTVANAQVTYSPQGSSGQETSGTVATVTCNSANGYTLADGVSTVQTTTCANTVWTPAISQCVLSISCATLATVPAAIYTPACAANKCAIGATASITCPTGGVLSSGTNCGITDNCKADGTWTFTTLDCGCTLPTGTYNSYSGTTCTTAGIAANGDTPTLTCTGTSTVAGTCANTLALTCTNGVLSPTVTSTTCALTCSILIDETVASNLLLNAYASLTYTPARCPTVALPGTLSAVCTANSFFPDATSTKVATCSAGVWDVNPLPACACTSSVFFDACTTNADCKSCASAPFIYTTMCDGSFCICGDPNYLCLANACCDGQTCDATGNCPPAVKYGPCSLFDPASCASGLTCVADARADTANLASGQYGICT